LSQETLNVRIPARLKEDVRRYCRKTGITISHYVRFAIESLLYDPFGLFVLETGKVPNEA